MCINLLSSPDVVCVSSFYIISVSRCAFTCGPTRCPVLCCQVSTPRTPRVVLWCLYQVFHFVKALSHLCEVFDLPDDLVQGEASWQVHRLQSLLLIGR